ncbi:hypothetical protein GALMADRAFT_241960 [Galerina marginata CBS 339.88]|uniref:F-box domain-containing protein n=1 Tax=Galerina marginata (strain CBS 339.88) TaxID=685588 RepID=A0A067TBY0_GALM3|nr:hypothetical protein GALMADRAFT_241960 [Galerina marginata CBS 339.88]
MLKSLCLTNLGVDVLINVMVFLRPMDIINLRQTCKTLKLSTMHRIVWVDALKQMMDEQRIPEATFPTSSMDREALEHTALSPAKFSSILEKSADNKIHPFSIRILPDYLSKQEMSKHGIQSYVHYSDMILAPGGRFMVTSLDVLAPGAKNLVQLWDIGVCGHGDKAKVRVQAILESKPIRLLTLAPVPDGSGFYLVSEQFSNARAIIVHKISAFGTFPTITRVNKYAVSSDVISLSISGTRLACICDPSTAVVWDFEAQLSASWDCQIEQDAQLPLSIHLYADHVLLYRSGKLILWKSPELHEEIQGVPPQHRRLSTYSDLFHDQDNEDSDSEAETYLLPHSPWFGILPGSQFLGISKTPDFGLIPIEHLPSVPNGNIPSILPTRMMIFRDLDLDLIAGPADMSELRVCNRRLLVSALDTDEDMMYIQMLPMMVDGSKVDPLPKKQLILRCRDMTPSYAQLCAATGRLCIVVGDTDIHIIDYLQPPW